MKLEELRKELDLRRIDLTDRMAEQLDFYARYLVEYNEKVNLTSITEYEDIIDKHFYDSLLFVDRKLEGTFVDVGTGAGFPGMVVKIVFPELKVVLIEPIKKRCVFLESLIEKLGLSDIEVVNERAEDYSIKHREEYDYVTARAVTNVSNLIEICGAMVKQNGYFICLRGRDGRKEIEDGMKAIRTMKFDVEKVVDENLFNGDERVIAYLKKTDKTPSKYPRKYNIIKKNPL